MQLNGETVWKWLMRLCAVAGFGALLTTKGLDAAPSFYILLLGLFFGPELITGKIKIIREAEEEDR